MMGLSVFSGAGGMDEGFKKAGVEVLLANDCDANACSSYRLNHQGIMLEGDIHQYLNEYKRHKGVDILFGGPPCQGFSVAGKMDPLDHRNILLMDFANLVNMVQPRAFVCENVSALGTLLKWKSVKEAFIATNSKEYIIAEMLLQASDFGVPQRRKRVFFLGIHKDLLSCTEKELGITLSRKMEQFHATGLSLGDIVRGLGRAGTVRNNKVCNAKIIFAKNPIIRKRPYDGMFFNGARALFEEGYFSTMVASMGGNKTPVLDEATIFDGIPSFIEEYHNHLIKGGNPFTGEAPSRLRRMTVQECMVAQTFPENYIFHGSQTSVYKQIGNAVPVHLAMVVGKAVVDTISNR